MLEVMVKALKDKQMAEIEFNMATNEFETDIAIYKMRMAELNISRIIKISKGELHE